MREQQQGFRRIRPAFAVIADDDVVLVRLTAAEKDVLLGEASVAKALRQRVGDLRRPTADVDAIELDDLLVDVARVLLRRRQCLRSSRCGDEREHGQNGGDSHRESSGSGGQDRPAAANHRRCGAAGPEPSQIAMQTNSVGISTRRVLPMQPPRLDSSECLTGTAIRYQPIFQRSVGDLTVEPPSRYTTMSFRWASAD